MAAPAATTATPPFASRQRGGEGLFALKSLASDRSAGATTATLSSRPKASPFCREVEQSCGRGVTGLRPLHVIHSPVRRAAEGADSSRGCERDAVSRFYCAVGAPSSWLALSWRSQPGSLWPTNPSGASHCRVQAALVQVEKPEPHPRARKPAVVEIPTGSNTHVEVIVGRMLVVELQDMACWASPDQAIGNAEHDDVVERKRRRIVNRLACIRLIVWFYGHCCAATMLTLSAYRTVPKKLTLRWSGCPLSAPLDGKRRRDVGHIGSGISELPRWLRGRHASCDRPSSGTRSTSAGSGAPRSRARGRSPAGWFP
jgi:hypothetical protein